MHIYFWFGFKLKNLSAVFLGKAMVIPIIKASRTEDNPASTNLASSLAFFETCSWEDWAKRFNEYLKHIESLFYPEMIIIGGGASKKHKQFFQYLEVNARVVPAKLSNHAGIIGAARYAEKNLKIITDIL